MVPLNEITILSFFTFKVEKLLICITFHESPNLNIHYSVINLFSDCHSKDTKLLGGIIGEGIPYVAGFKECARECQKQHNQVTREGRPQAACHYFTYYDASFVRPSTRSNNWPKDCELHSQDHCGFYGSHCQQKEVVGVESGSLTSCEGKNFI